MLYSVDDYILVKVIGKGNFGDVYLTQKQNCGELFATKKMNRSICDQPSFFNRLSYEVGILQAVNHPNIIKYIDLKKTNHNYYLITEFANGGSLKYNLWRYMTAYHRPFPEDIVQYLMKQIVDAVKYLHFNKIIHRDLKLDNILINYKTEQDKINLNLKNCQIKIIDFGFAKVLDNQFTFTTLGTPYNMEPKILEDVTTGKPNTGYNEKADIWSLGTLCYEMVVGHTPFEGSTFQELYQKVKNGHYTLPMTLSEELISFINDMLQQEPKQRADAYQLSNHKFLVNPISSFHHIDAKKIPPNYLSEGMINISSKQPETKTEENINIWSIFNDPTFNQGPKSVQFQNQVQHIQPVQPNQKYISGQQLNYGFQIPQQQQIYSNQFQNQYQYKQFYY